MVIYEQKQKKAHKKMTKFILVLYSCSFMTMQCGSGTYLTKHDTW